MIASVRCWLRPFSSGLLPGLLLVATPTWAVARDVPTDRVAIDTPAALPAPERERLATPVTLQVDGRELDELAANLTRDTKIKLSVDPRIAALKVNVKVDQIPLHRLMALLAD